jgi:hypothetical protein
MDFSNLILLNKSISSYDLAVKKTVFDRQTLLFSNLDKDLSDICSKFISNKNRSLHRHNSLSDHEKIEEEEEDSLEEGEIVDDIDTAKIYVLNRNSINDDQRKHARHILRNKLKKKIANKHLEKFYDSNYIKNIVKMYEESIYEHFSSNYRKYSLKIKAISSNIQSIENNTFFKKILNKQIKPNDLARMNTTDMASDERIKERLKAIQQDIKDRESLAVDLQKSNKIIKKTHKGEFEIDLNGSRLKNELAKISWKGKLIIERLNFDLKFVILSPQSFFETKIKTDFLTKIGLSLNFAQFDSFTLENDLMVQLKKEEKYNKDIIFIKFESNSSLEYSSLYNYLVKKQCSFEPNKGYAKMTNLPKNDWFNKFYLFPLRNKNESFDPILKRHFNIHVERDKDLVLGILVSKRVNLKSTNNNDDDFAKYSTYEVLFKLFSLILQDNSLQSMDFAQNLILTLAKSDKLALLTDEERLKLKNQFSNELPGLVLMVVHSSPNSNLLGDRKNRLSKFKRPKIEKKNA